MSDWPTIAAVISEASGSRFANPSARTISGGCINEATLLTAGGEQVFVKVNRAERLAMFEAEAAGLALIAASATIRVPRPICTGVVGTEAFIAMEALALIARGDAAAAGRGLAALHRVSADSFGWERDNTIGATPQPNRPNPDWTAFFARERLGHQLALAARNGHRGRLQTNGERLLERLPALLDHAPTPSLLHGDLWGGNLGYLPGGEPVVFDPAVYFGDREADLAMTELFGGLGRDFHAAYQEAWPLPASYPVRKTLYNLYHILNHLNLFGSGYRAQAEAMIEQLLAEVG